MKTVFWIWIALLMIGCQPPPPIDLIIGLDTSASFAKAHTQALETIEALSGRLDPGNDRLSLFRMDQQGIRLLREGPAPDLKGLQAVLKAYAGTANSQYKGTPYRLLMQRMRSQIDPKRQTQLVILGDLADETARDSDEHLSADFLQHWAKQLPANSRIAFLDISPRFEEQLIPLRHSLGERLMIVSAAEEAASQSGRRQILAHIKR